MFSWRLSVCQWFRVWYLFFFIICSSSLLLLVPWEGCASWLWRFLGIFTYILHARFTHKLNLIIILLVILFWVSIFGHICKDWLLNVDFYFNALFIILRTVSTCFLNELWHLRSAQTQISLHIDTDWSEYSLCSIAKDPRLLLETVVTARPIHQ